MRAAFERARKALDFLERHQLDPTVPHYALALAYMASPGSELARTIEAETDGGIRLNADMAAALSDRFLRSTEAFAVGQRERTVALQAAELSSLSSEAHDVTSALEQDVGTIVAEARDVPPGADRFVDRLSEAERQLAEVRAEIAKLQSRIGDRNAGPEEAERDQLTQALNQSGAQRILEQLSDYNRDYVLLMFGLDDLIGINTRFGRPVGDNVVNAFATTLEQTFAEQELIRWTGNEFIVVMKDTTLTGAHILADAALTAMRARRLKLRGSGEWIGVVTASAGMVIGRDGPVELSLEGARAKLSAATSQGGDRIAS